MGGGFNIWGVEYLGDGIAQRNFPDSWNMKRDGVALSQAPLLQLESAGARFCGWSKPSPSKLTPMGAAQTLFCRLPPTRPCCMAPCRSALVTQLCRKCLVWAHRNSLSQMCLSQATTFCYKPVSRNDRSSCKTQCF